MSRADEIPPPVPANFLGKPAPYPYPHLKQLIQTSELFMSSLIRDEERIVEKYTHRVIAILATEMEYVDAESPGPHHLSILLQTLWEFPSELAEIEIEMEEYREFYAALVKDGVNVSMLPPP